MASCHSNSWKSLYEPQASGPCSIFIGVLLILAAYSDFGDTEVKVPKHMLWLNKTYLVIVGYGLMQQLHIGHDVGNAAADHVML